MPKTVLSVCVVLALMGIPLYFSTRDRSRPASGVEKIAATAWVWFRRILGVGMGGLMIAGAVQVAYGYPASVGHRALAAGGLALLGIFLIYFGIIGQGTNRYQWRDDIDLHKQNKRRYRWWF